MTVGIVYNPFDLHQSNIKKSWISPENTSSVLNVSWLPAVNSPTEVTKYPKIHRHNFDQVDTCSRLTVNLRSMPKPHEHV